MDKMSEEELIGRLKAHEERVHVHGENIGNLLLLTQEEWIARSNGRASSESSLNQKGRSSYNGGHRGRGRGRVRGSNERGGTSYRNVGHYSEGNQSTTGGKDKSKVKILNCDIYGHYASEC